MFRGNLLPHVLVLSIFVYVITEQEQCVLKVEVPETVGKKRTCEPKVSVAYTVDLCPLEHATQYLEVLMEIITEIPSTCKLKGVRKPRLYIYCRYTFKSAFN